MNKRFLTISAKRLPPALVVLAAALLAGCRWPDLAPASPQLRGRWTGRVVVVTVYGQDERRYEVAALELLDGPDGYLTQRPGRRASANLQYVRGRFGPDTSYARLPLLAADGPETPTLRAADMPVGKRVSVRGVLMVYTALSPRTPPNGSEIVTRVPRGGGDAHEPGLRREHVLVVQSRVKVLRE